MEHYECACALRRAKELEEQAAAAGAVSPLAKSMPPRVRVRLRVPCYVDLLLSAEGVNQLDRDALLELADRAIQQARYSTCGKTQEIGQLTIPVDFRVGPAPRTTLDRMLALDSVTEETQ